jgi:hypothetical protein
MHNLFRFPSAPLFAGLFVCALTGCSVTHVVPQGKALERKDSTSLAVLARHNDAKIELRNGLRYDGQRIAIRGDSLGLARKGLEDSAVALEDVRSVSFVNHGLSAGQGAGIGLLCLGGIGIAAGILSGDTPDEEIRTGFFSDETRIQEGATAHQKAVKGGLLGGVLGLLIGGILGSATGSEEIFRFDGPAVRAPDTVSHATGAPR